MKFTAFVATALAAVASAFDQPDYTQPPSGNPISKPGLQQQVPAGAPFTITWQATSPGPVSLTLLRGPSENVKPLMVITPSTPNSGTYTWNVPIDLENDVTHYGILLFDLTTKQYQWSTQFGIENKTPSKPSLSVTRTVIEPSGSASASVSATRTLLPTGIRTLTTTICDETVSHRPTGTAPAGTAPGTISPRPTTQVPTTYRATPKPTPSQPVFEGAAGRNALSVGGAVLALAAIAAF